MTDVQILDRVERWRLTGKNKENRKVPWELLLLTCASMFVVSSSAQAVYQTTLRVHHKTFRNSFFFAKVFVFCLARWVKVQVVKGTLTFVCRSSQFYNYLDMMTTKLLWKSFSFLFLFRYACLLLFLVLLALYNISIQFYCLNLHLLHIPLICNFFMFLHN